jgi:hypothetical protein
MESNAKYEFGRNLTYTQYVSKFVYGAKSTRWQPRKQGYTIGRLNWVSPSIGELYYLRIMLAIAKGLCGL